MADTGMGESGNGGKDGGRGDEERLAALLEAHTARQFTPGFADRVMTRVREEAVALDAGGGMAELAASMAMMMRRLAVPAMAACLLLAAHNVTVAESSAFGQPDSLIDAIFALVPVSADAALAL